jgi:non-specific serine/threonine protein kinase
MARRRGSQSELDRSSLRPGHGQGATPVPPEPAEPTSPSVAEPTSPSVADPSGADFRELVHGALARLYDAPALETHPLATMARRDQEAGKGSAGQRLRRILLDAVGALESVPAPASRPRAERAHRLLTMRYVEGVAIRSIQRELAVSRSEYFREHARAVEAVAAVLRERWERPAPVAPSPRRTGTLPTPLTSFVGRKRAIADVARLIGEARLVTLAGPGGVGKSRLALRVAADRAAAFPDGVRFVDLAPLTDETLVPAAVASAVGASEVSGRPPVEALLDWLAPRSMLVILDNCEHLVLACARLAEALLRACPNLHLFATSREPLHAAGEAVWRVAPLSSPEPDGIAADEALLRYEAVRLFTERARLVQPDFAIAAANAAAVAQICRRLDGIPLALELAAARLGTMSVEDVAARLDDGFRLLTGGYRTALPRQQTLRAAVDWSHDLLREPERVLFRHAAVFAGGWTLDAAEAVCPGEGIAAGDVLDLLTGLVDKSLIVGDGGRYRMLDTIRQYARQRPESDGERQAVERRHAHYYLDLTERAGSELHRPNQSAWLARIEAEHDNVRAALRWSIDNRAAGMGLRAAGALYLFWMQRHVAEGRAWLADLLEAPGGPDDDGRALALATAGALAGVQGEHDLARRLLEEAVALARLAGVRDGPDAGRRDGSVLALALLGLGAVDGFQGDYATARARVEESLAVARAAGDPWGAARSLYLLAEMASGQGDDAAGRRQFEASLAAFREVGDGWGTAYSLRALGLAAYRAGEHGRARTLCAESLAIGQALGDRALVAWSLWCQGLAALEQGELGVARGDFGASLAIFRERGERGPMAQVLTGLAGLAARDGRAELAVTLAGAAEAALASIGARLPPADQADVDRWLAPARRALGPRASAATAAGRALSLEAVLARAVASAAPDERRPEPSTVLAARARSHETGAPASTSQARR